MLQLVSVRRDSPVVLDSEEAERDFTVIFILNYLFISYLFQQECDKLLHQSLMKRVSGIQAAQESHCTGAWHLIVSAVTGKGEYGPLVAVF